MPSFLEVTLQLTSAAAAKLLQSCPTLCNSIDGSPPGSPIPGILQARTLEWIAISFSNAWKWKVKVNSLSRVVLRDPMDCSLPGFSIHGIFQARVLEWVAVYLPTKVRLVKAMVFPSLEKEMATLCSVLAWRIPGMGEPGGLSSMGSHRVGDDWSDLAAAAALVWWWL